MTPPQIHTAAGRLRAWAWLPKPLRGARALLSGVVSTMCVTALCAAIDSALPAHGVAMFYILAVVGSAVAFGMLSGIAAATASFLAYNYFFLQPTYTFTIANPPDLVSLLMFFAVAIAAGSLAGRLREAAEQAQQRAQSLETLNALATRLTRASGASDVTEALRSEASRISGQPAIILLASRNGAEELSAAPDMPPLSTADWQAAHRCAASRNTMYPVAAGWDGSHYEFRAIAARDRVAAVLGVRQSSYDEANDAAIDAMVQHTAAVLERMTLEAEKSAVEHQAEAERLRSALLSSVSHDIKTPLAAIQGAASSLRTLGTKLPEESKSELLATIEEEALHLSRFVGNMLDMVRLEAGPAGLGKTWIDLADTLATAVRHARKIMPDARIRLDVRIAPALVQADEVLLEHVFLNVLENAAHASPHGAEITVVLEASKRESYRVEILDDGPGIAHDVLPHIFEKFYRAPGTKARGSGLGLAICKEVMAALGGRIAAESPIANGRGTRMSLTFPKAHTPAATGDLP